MKNTCVGYNRSTRAGRRARRGVRSSRAPRPAPSSWSDGRARRDMSERRGAGNPQDADGVSVWRSTPDGGLDAGVFSYCHSAALVVGGTGATGDRDVLYTCLPPKIIRSSAHPLQVDPGDAVRVTASHGWSHGGSHGRSQRGPQEVDEQVEAQDDGVGPRVRLAFPTFGKSR